MPRRSRRRRSLSEVCWVAGLLALFYVAAASRCETCEARLGNPFRAGADLFNKNAPRTGWKSKPTWYMLANNDQTVHLELQLVAKRIGDTTYAI